MKRLLVSLALASAALLGHAAGNDIVFTKRNAADTAQGPLTPAHPTTCVGLMAYDAATLLPVYLCPGAGLTVSGGVIDVASGSAPTWSTLVGKPSWTGVFDGSYASLTSPPTLGTAAPLNVASSGNASTGQVVKGDDTRLTDARTPTTHTHAAADISDSTTTGRAVLTAASQAAARTAIGAGTSSFSGSYGDLTSVPSTFTPAAHTHAIADVTGLQTALNGKAATSTTLAGYGITDGVTSTSLASTLSGYATSASLATGLSGKLDVPSGTAAQCVKGNGTVGSCGGAGTVTSVGISSTTLSVGGSPVTSSGSMTVDLPTVATAGTYDRVTVDAQGRVTSGAAAPFNFSQPAARSLAVSTSYQANDPTKAAVIYPSYACQNATTVLAASGCTVQVRMGTGTLTCSTGTVYYTQSLTVALGVLITQNSTNPVPIFLPIGASFIFCQTTGTFTITTVEQTAG